MDHNVICPKITIILVNEILMLLETSKTASMIDVHRTHLPEFFVRLD